MLRFFALFAVNHSGQPWRLQNGFPSLRRHPHLEQRVRMAQGVLDLFGPLAPREQETQVAVYGLARDGKVGRNGLPSLLRLAVIVHDLGEEVGGPGIPRSLQHALVALFAAVGHRLGYRACYAEYSGTEPEQ